MTESEDKLIEAIELLQSSIAQLVNALQNDIDAATMFVIAYNQRKIDDIRDYLRS